MVKSKSWSPWQIIYFSPVLCLTVWWRCRIIRLSNCDCPDISACFFRYFEEHDGTITLLEEKKNSVVRIGPGNLSVWHLSKRCNQNISCRFDVAAKSGPAFCRKLFLLKPQIKHRYSEHQCCWRWEEIQFKITTFTSPPTRWTHAGGDAGGGHEAPDVWQVQPPSPSLEIFSHPSSFLSGCILSLLWTVNNQLNIEKFDLSFVANTWELLWLCF